MTDQAASNRQAFRQFEYEGWNRLSEGYHRHWEHLTTQIVPAMLDAVEVVAGMEVLDVASGPGYVSGSASRRGAHTTGLDFSENMVALASRNFPGLSFTRGDAEILPFGDKSFDAVLINFGLLHFPDADRALAEAYRALRPGGRLGFTAWAGPEGSAIGIAMGAIAREGTLDVDLPAGTPIFRFADHGECARTLGEIGFADPVSTDMLLTWSLPAVDMLMDVFNEATARTSGLLRAQDPARLPTIKAAMTAGCRPFERDGRAELPMPSVLTVATKT